MKGSLKKSVIAISALNILILLISIATLCVSVMVLQTAKKGSSDIIQVVGKQAMGAPPQMQLPMAINQILDRIIQLQVVENQPQKEACTSGIYYPKLHNYTNCVYAHAMREGGERNDARYYEEACIHFLM